MDKSIAGRSEDIDVGSPPGVTLVHAVVRHGVGKAFLVVDSVVPLVDLCLHAGRIQAQGKSLSQRTKISIIVFQIIIKILNGSL